jgi:tetratricopeptide (TPR) repeat protein
MPRQADHKPNMSQLPIADSGRLVSPRQALWTVLACATILAAGIAAWSNSFNGAFIFDDLYAIQNNPTLLHFPAWQNFAPPAARAVSRRPVVNLTFAINYAIGGLDVRGFHAGNLLIHLLAALALFGVVRRTLTAAPLSERFGGAASGLAMAVALIWAVHPLLTESVSYLTQRTECLMGLFLLLTLYSAIRSASSERPGRWYAAAVAACALGMGAKEVMAIAPIVVLVCDRCFLSGSFREALRRRWPLYLGLAATWAILGALLIAYPWGEATGAGFGLAEAGPWEYARTQPGVILNYLRLSLWPNPLCLDYFWPIATSARQIIPAGTAIAALLAATFWALRRAPALGFLGAWFFLILAPTSSFVPIVTEVAAERRMYLPLAAIVTGCVLAAYWLGRKLVLRAAESAGTRKLLGGVLAAAALLSATAALGYGTFERNAYYRDAISIWQDTVAKRPLDPRAQNNLGASYFQAGRANEAIRCFNRAIELKRDYLDALNDRGAAYTETGQIVEAIGDLDKAIALKPDFAEAYNNRGAAYLKAGRLDEAIRDYSRAIELQPDYADALENRSNAYLQSKRYELAIADCNEAIKLRPDHQRAYINRAVAYWRTQQYEKALADVQMYREKGGQPPPALVEALLWITGRSK